MSAQPGSFSPSSGSVEVAPAPPLAPTLSPPPPPSRSRGRLVGWGALGAVVLVAAMVFSYRAAHSREPGAVMMPASVKTARVLLAPLEVTVRVTGQTSARNFANIVAPPMRGAESFTLVLIKAAKPGSIVHKGDIIAEIDGKPIQDHLDDVADTVRAAQADVRKRQAEHQVEMETLRQTLRVAKAELDKARLELRAAEVRTSIEQELLKLNLEEAEAKYQQAQSDVGDKQASQAAEIKILQITAHRHQRHFDRHTADLAHLTMRAPMTGLVVMQMVFRGAEFGQVQEGDQLYPGMSFIKIVDPASMQVEAVMNQAESAQFRVNQPATVRFDAFPGLTLPGHTYAIGALAVPGARNSYFARTVPLKVKIDGHDPQLLPDLSASSDIVVGRAERALQIPLAAVQREDTPGSGSLVYVVTANGYEKRAIGTGLRNATTIAVTNGLREGETVVVGPVTASAALL